MKQNQNKYIAALLFLISLSLYIFTMPPAIFWQDAGIYATGIYVEGNVYPPGFPLYMILEELWKSIVPIGSFVQKVEVLSAIFTAISSVFIYLSLKILLNNKDTLFKKIRPLNKDNSFDINSKQNQPKENNQIISTVLSIIGALSFTLNYNVWAQANNVEVYAFHSLFITFILYIILKIGLNGKVEKQIDSKTTIYFYLLAITYGLSFGNHPMTILLIPTFLILLFLQSNIFFHPKTLIVSLILFIFSGFITYAYLPVVASKQPVLNWGNPNTIERFVTQVTGKVYITNDQSFVFNDITRYQAALQEFVWEYSYIGLVLALVGAIILFKKNKTIFSIFISILLIHTIFAVFYKQTTEYNSWLIPAHISIIFLISISSQFILEKSISSYPQNKFKALAIFIPLVLFSVFTISHFAENAKELDRRQYYYAEDFGKNIIRNLDQDSIIFLTGDQESSTIMFLQTVQGFRTDVIAIKNIEFEDFLHAEGRILLQKKYPRLRFPQLDTQDDQQTYLNKLISENINQKSIYLMSKSAFKIDQSKFSLIPAAAIWKLQDLSLAQGDIDLKYWDFKYHDPLFFNKKERALMSLKDPSKPGGINRVPFIQHMINFELQSWKNLGDWYIQKHLCDDAKSAYYKMKIVQPKILDELPQIQQNIDSCYDQYQ